jgi:hypothetical protein
MNFLYPKHILILNKTGLLTKEENLKMYEESDLVYIKYNIVPLISSLQIYNIFYTFDSSNILLGLDSG